MLPGSVQLIIIIIPNIIDILLRDNARSYLFVQTNLSNKILQKIKATVNIKKLECPVVTGSYGEGDASAPQTDTQLISETDIIDWLSNKEVISTIMSCTEDAMDALKRYSSKGLWTTIDLISQCVQHRLNTYVLLVMLCSKLF